MNKKYVYNFYRFLKLKNKNHMKKEIDIFLSKKIIKGTILIADEGFNGSVSGEKEELNQLIIFLKKIFNIRKLEIKINEVDFAPFNRMKVRLKKEIVTLGKGKIDVEKLNGIKIEPKDWDKIIRDDEIYVIDVRNNFEIEIGSFENSINPNTKSFREFSKYVDKLKLKKNNKIAMYCTGGIRCEKASSYLKKCGYKNVMQLKGGIIGYLNYNLKNKKKLLWNGECFVFDDRVTVNKSLMKGKYIQCFGCRRPITKKDTFSKKYIKGVSCPYCYDKRSESQKKRSQDRQNQIFQAERYNRQNVFLKN